LDGRDLTLIEMIDRRVALPLSRGERVWSRFLFCGDEKLGCIVDGDYTAMTLIVMLDRRVGLSLSQGRGYGVDCFSVVMKSWVA
jgi:hypothetical protein